jgi:hypothetical protein
MLINCFKVSRVVSLELLAGQALPLERGEKVVERSAFTCNNGEEIAVEKES